MTYFLRTCQSCSGHLFPDVPPRGSQTGGGRGRRRHFFSSSPSAISQGISAPGPIPVPCSGGCRGEWQLTPLGNAEQISSRWGRGHAQLFVARPLLLFLLLLFLAGAQSISVHWAVFCFQESPLSCSMNLVVLCLCQPSCPFGDDIEACWRPVGYVLTPGLSSPHPSLWAQSDVNSPTIPWLGLFPP